MSVANRFFGVFVETNLDRYAFPDEAFSLIIG